MEPGSRGELDELINDHMVACCYRILQDMDPKLLSKNGRTGKYSV